MELKPIEREDVANDLMELNSFEETDLVDALSELIEKGTTTISEFLTSETVDVLLATGVEIGEESLKLFKIFSIIRKCGSLPDKFFIKKVKKFCQGVLEIPEEQRNAFVEHVGKKKLNETSNFILSIIISTEEEEKFNLYSTILKARVNGIIDDVLFRRLMILVSRTLHLDLRYLVENYTDKYVVIDCDEKQGLVSAGWLYYEGMSVGTATEPCAQLYKYISLARIFKEIL